MTLPVPTATLTNLSLEDAPPPSIRTVEDAMALLAEIESGAIEVFARYGLPTATGLYRRELPHGEWALLEVPSSPQDRWNAILNRPPEAGYRYLKLTDVARAEKSEFVDVQRAAATLDRASDLARLLSQSDGEDDDPALLMFWSTVELMAMLFDGGARSNGRKVAECRLQWGVWRAEANRIWETSPEMSVRSVAKLVVSRLGLSESHHSVRRRLVVPNYGDGRLSPKPG